MTPRRTFEARARALLGADRLQADAALAPLTTFGVGGAAEWLAEVRSVEELTRLLADARAAHLDVTLLGGGSNVLVADAGVPGLVIRLRLSAITQVSSSVVRAEAGVSINGLVRWTIGRGLEGLQAWAGTPGTVGGAIHGNAHWGERNIGDLVRKVQVVSHEGELLEVNEREMAFAYDTSRLQQTREILVWAEFGVGTAPVATLREEARASLHYRKRTQPLALPSAGCVFRNPDPAVDRLPDGLPHSAGALVDRAGLKGRRIGGARISETHANFIVADRGATAADVKALIDTARRTVADRFGVGLRDEIVYLGTFGHG